MKKKILLLPIILISSFFGSCTYRTPFIPLEEILTIDRQGKHSYYYYDNIEFYDYKDDMFNLLKTYVSNAEIVKKIDDGISVTRYDVKRLDYRFNIEGYYKKMDYFIIAAYDTGDVEVRTKGSGWPMYPENQNTLYKMSEENTAELFSKVESYVEEMNTALQREEEEVKEASKIDNFFTAYSNLDNREVTYCYYHIDQKEKRPCMTEIPVNDKDGDYLELLVDLEYKRCPKDTYIYVSSEQCIKVSINNKWYMVLDYEQATGYVYYEYESEYKGLTAYQYYFTVNNKKIEALYKKLYNEIEDKL